MSVRIYHLSKKLKKTNQELLSLLQKRGFNVKTHSNTIDSISAEALIKEFTKEKEDTSLPTENQSTPDPPTPKKVKPDIGQGSSPVSPLKAETPVKKTEEVEKNKSIDPSPPAQTAHKDPVASKKEEYSSQNVAQPTATVKEEKEEFSSDPSILEASEPPQSLQVKSPIIVRDFAMLLGLKPFQLISELMELGIFASMNQVIEEETAQEIAQKKGFQLEIRHRGEQAASPQETKKVPKKEPPKEKASLESRPAIVCILGHVDHGKTTLLDTIRKTNLVTEESGGITQHIGAYQITHNNEKITFIDTPGHAAFSKMRKRGADVTDIAILIVAADDGFMPQTDEALGYAQSFKVPIIVAINKTDAPGANVDKVKQQMQERNITPEEWGGETIVVCISALKGEGIDNLLEMITLQTEIMELKALYKAPAEGIIIESQKDIGHGSTASAIIQTGTLKIGDALISGSVYCKVRSLIDDRGKKLKQIVPSSPVKITGWSGTLEAGSLFRTVKNERIAKAEAEENALQVKLVAARAESKNISDSSTEDNQSALDLLFSNIEKTQKHIFRVVIKADVYGAAEALAASLETIPSKNVSMEVLYIGVGVINKKDIQVAAAAKATIVGFNVNLENGVSSLAKHEGISIFRHSVIYELVDTVKEAMAELLDPEIEEVKIGTAEVREIFSLSKRIAAGCFVTDGKIIRDAPARLIRNGKVIDQGKIRTLKRFKDDANEVRSGYECGISLDGDSDYQPKDLIECYKINKKLAVL